MRGVENTWLYTFFFSFILHNSLYIQYGQKEGRKEKGRLLVIYPNAMYASFYWRQCCRDEAFEEDAAATGADTTAAPAETEEDFEKRASAFSALATENNEEEEEEDG